MGLRFDQDIFMMVASGMEMAFLGGKMDQWCQYLYIPPVRVGSVFIPRGLASLRSNERCQAKRLVDC